MGQLCIQQKIRLYLYYFLFFNSLFITKTFAVSCSLQLHEYYETFGLLPIFPVLPVVTTTSGVLLGVPFVTLSLNFQTVSLIYQSQPGVTAPTPVVSFISLDLPYCYTDIEVSCATRDIFGIERIGSPSPQCPLDDRDPSFGSSTAGRLFIYPDQSNVSCLNTSTITIYNVTFNPLINGSFYTYDVFGLRTGNLTNEDLSISRYRSEACNNTDGNVTNSSSINQFECTAATLQCANARPVDNVTIVPTTLTIQYQCFGLTVVTGGSSAFSVYSVLNDNAPVDDIETDFDLTFIESPSGIPIVGIILNGTGLNSTNYLRQLIKPAIIRQYLIPYPTLNYYANLTTGAVNPLLNMVTNFPSITEYVIPDTAVIQIPCICNFSIYCFNDGSINDDEAGSPYYFNNTPPVAIGGTLTPVVPFNSTVDLRDMGSFDPDNFPLPFITYYWIPIALYVLDTTTNLYTLQTTTFFINNTNVLFTGNASFTSQTFQNSIYAVALIVSDGQNQNISYVNISSIDSQPSINQKDQNITINCPFVQGVLIYLNATDSLNPFNQTLNVSWTQVSGYFVQILNNDTLLASFNATLAGVYIFSVNITTNTSSSNGAFNVRVLRGTCPPIPDDSTNAPTTLPSNHTNPPNFTNVPTLPVFTEPPFTPAPTSPFVPPVPVIYPPLFPPMPDGIDTSGQRIGVWALIAIIIGFCIFTILWVLLIKLFPDNYVYVTFNPYH